MADVEVRESEDEEWRKIEPWRDIHSDRAEEIVEVYDNREIYDRDYRVKYRDWETPSGDQK